MLNDERVNRSKSRKYTIFMFFIFVIASLMILLWAYNIYESGVAAASGEESEVATCWSYSYSISNIRYENKTLSFILENKFYSDARISKFTIITDNGKIEREFPPLSKGLTREIIIEDAVVTESFLAYPEDCIGLSKKYNVN